MRGRWLTPDTIPTERAYCQLEIPDSEEIRALVRGALYLLSDEENYEEFGAVTAQELADEMRKTLLLFNLEDCMTFPVGACIDWPSNTIPSGWLDTNQSAVSRTTYANLFAVIGTTWGVGNGTTTFDLPHKDGRVTIGKKSSDTDFDTLGETGGAKTVTLITSEIPSHTHVQNAHTHSQNAHSHNQADHSHTLQGTSESAGSTLVSNKLLATPAGNTYKNTAGGIVSLQSSAALANGASIDTTAATNQNSTPTNQNTGGGGSHNNVQPYVVMNYIIKY